MNAGWCSLRRSPFPMSEWKKNVTLSSLESSRLARLCQQLLSEDSHGCAGGWLSLVPASARVACLFQRLSTTKPANCKTIRLA